MCGITGLYAKRNLPDESLVKLMTERLHHRGPIEDGYYADAPISLGMRRLSIVDIEGGHQPVFNEDHRIGVMLNGQIYNYVELADELQARGHRFYTRSDTEVIAHLYEEMGPNCVTRFNGMFAIALWDVQKRQLFIARDRLGVKPLYYFENGETFAFASELKSLLLCPFVPHDLDADALEEYLTFMYIRAPRTPFKHISKLLPGHWMRIDSSGTRIQRWWDLREHCQPSDLSLPQATERLRELLSDAVRLRLRSDVPVGAFLSGGLDSSAITAFAARQLPHAVNTYAVGFAGDGFDELGYAKIVADAFKTNHHATTVTVDDALQHLPQLVWHLDEPHGDSAMIPTYLVSKVAAHDLRVILSGLGGDELFGGYMRYFDGYPIEHVYRRLPSWLRRTVLTPVAGLLGPAFGARARRNNLSDELRYLDFVTIFPESSRQRILRERHHTATLCSEFESFPNSDKLNRMMFVDALTYLPDDVLHITDRMSMAVSLEVRPPFLDYRLVEFAASLPGRFKMNPWRREWKSVLKQAMQPILPSPILTRRKWGFGAPVDAWMKKGLVQTARTVLRDSSAARIGLIDSTAVQDYLENPLPAEGWFRWQRIWTLLVLEIWTRVFVDGQAMLPSFTLADLDQ
ncbi:MAG: asparagine synthase (glutamine-hydrolyzing) [Chloroflexi bacterium]|nr:asparagine synthase (glutamine-hydrolyzing) [Chloroflexota bacterium]